MKDSNARPAKMRLNSNLFWRNLMPFLIDKDSQFFNCAKDREYLINVLQDTWLKGLVFELIDGDNFQFQGEVLSLFNDINTKGELLIVGVMGPQSSGKSTLMNFMTGSDFGTSNGICTKGINCFLKSQTSIERYLEMIR